MVNTDRHFCFCHIRRKLHLNSTEPDVDTSKHRRYIKDFIGPNEESAQKNIHKFLLLQLPLCQRKNIITSIFHIKMLRKACFDVFVHPCFFPKLGQREVATLRKVRPSRPFRVFSCSRNWMDGPFFDRKESPRPPLLLAWWHLSSSMAHLILSSCCEAGVTCEPSSHARCPYYITEGMGDRDGDGDDDGDGSLVGQHWGLVFRGGNSWDLCRNFGEKLTKLFVLSG